MKKYIFILMAGWTLTSCNKQTAVPPPIPQSSVMVYNASPEFLGVNASIAITDSTGHTDSLVASYNTVGIGEGHDPYGVGAIASAHYYNFSPGPYRIFFTDSSRNPLSGGLLQLPRDAHRTVFLTDSLGYFSTIVTNDDVTRTPGSATIRLINLSPDAGPVDLALDSTAVAGATGISYGQISAFVTVPVTLKSGIRVATSETPAQLLSRKSFPLESGHCYTLILRGYIDPPHVEGETESARLNKTISLSALINQ